MEKISKDTRQAHRSIGFSCHNQKINATFPSGIQHKKNDNISTLLFVFRLQVIHMFCANIIYF